MAAKHILSKSTFVRSCQCLKSLYLYKHFPKLRDEIDVSQQMIFDRGTTIGELAQQLYPGGVDASPPTPYEYDKSIIKTAKLIEHGYKIIYEAAFQHNGVMAAMDILILDKGKWKAYEVKSSTSVKDQFVMDAALQYYVINGSGIKLSDISIIHINNEYVRKGEIDLDELFNTESVFEAVQEHQDFVEEQIQRAKDVLKQKEIPTVDIGDHCFSPYQCDFYGHCWKHIPASSVFNISRLGSDKKYELYKSGVLHFHDVPDEFPLNEGQRLQVNCHKKKETYINKKVIKEFLDTLKYPLWFLDFETIMPGVPLYDNSRPYQQIPFQYSLHYKKNPKSELKHFSFLADAKGDPRLPFIKQLTKELSSAGDVIVYNKGFETARLKELSNAFPKYSDQIEEIIDRVVDLMIPFQQKQYYSPVMNGSYSIKSVLPALVPELSYSNLAIGDGGTASSAFEHLINETDKEKISEVRKYLFEYCKLDTFGMVKILEALKSIS